QRVLDSLAGEVARYVFCCELLSIGSSRELLTVGFRFGAVQVAAVGGGVAQRGVDDGKVLDGACRGGNAAFPVVLRGASCRRFCSIVGTNRSGRARWTFAQDEDLATHVLVLVDRLLNPTASTGAKVGPS